MGDRSYLGLTVKEEDLEKFLTFVPVSSGWSEPVGGFVRSEHDNVNWYNELLQAARGKCRFAAYVGPCVGVYDAYVVICDGERYADCPVDVTESPIVPVGHDGVVQKYIEEAMLVHEVRANLFCGFRQEGAIFDPEPE